MSNDEILSHVLDCNINDIEYLFGKMDYSVFANGYDRAVSENTGSGVGITATDIWYDAIEYALMNIFGEDFELMSIDNNFQAAGITVSYEDAELIQDFDKKNDMFYEMTGFEILY